MQLWTPRVHVVYTTLLKKNCEYMQIGRCTVRAIHTHLEYLHRTTPFSLQQVSSQSPRATKKNWQPNANHPFFCDSCFVVVFVIVIAISMAIDMAIDMANAVASVGFTVVVVVCCFFMSSAVPRYLIFCSFVFSSGGYFFFCTV